MFNWNRRICLLTILFLIVGSLGQGTSYAETQEIKEHFKTLEVGSPFNYRNLTIVPVYVNRVNDKTDYVTLDEAIRKGYITITELDGGRVPQVRIDNNSNRYILLICGEILTGGKQDRLVGRDALVGPKTKDVILPVYCSERNRWSGKSIHFSSETSQAEPILRSMLYSKKDQSGVWGRIAEHAESLNVTSDTSALQDVYRDKKVVSEMDSYFERLESIPRLGEDAVGIVVGLNGEIVGIDIFANPEFFAMIWPKLLKSYIALAISQVDSKATLTQEKAKRILNEAYIAKFSRRPSVALGEDLEANIPEIICSALVYRGAVVHFAAFPTKERPNHLYPDARIRLID